MTDTPGTPGEIAVLDTHGDGTPDSPTQPRSTQASPTRRAPT